MIRRDEGAALFREYQSTRGRGLLISRGMCAPLHIRIEYEVEENSGPPVLKFIGLVSLCLETNLIVPIAAACHQKTKCVGRGEPRW